MERGQQQTHGVAPAVAAPDFRALFEQAPGLYLVLDPGFNIAAASDGYCRVTATSRSELIGRRVFEVVREDEDALRASLIAVLELRLPHAMAMRKYAARRAGTDEIPDERYWRRVNAPVAGPNGEVRWIVHSLEDLSEMMRTCQDEVTRRAFAREERRKIDRSGQPFRALADGSAGGGWGSFP